MRQIYPQAADLADDGLAALYAYPHPVAAPHWLRANMVSSLDGAATLAGRSGGLSGEADRHVFALLRALADVIVVGAGTVRAEHYRPIRPGSEGAAWAWLRAGRPAAPPIAIISRSLDLGPAAVLEKRPGEARTIVITTQAAPPARRAALDRTCEVIVAGDQNVDLRAAADALAAMGHRRLLTEGGPHLLSQIVGAGLLDELCLTLSPVLAGPGAGRIVQSPVPPEVPGQARPLTLAHVLTGNGYLLCRYVREG